MPPSRRARSSMRSTAAGETDWAANEEEPHPWTWRCASTAASTCSSSKSWSRRRRAAAMAQLKDRHYADKYRDRGRPIHLIDSGRIQQQGAQPGVVRGGACMSCETGKAEVESRSPEPRRTRFGTESRRGGHRTLAQPTVRVADWPGGGRRGERVGFADAEIGRPHRRDDLILFSDGRVIPACSR